MRGAVRSPPYQQARTRAHRGGPLHTYPGFIEPCIRLNATGHLRVAIGSTRSRLMVIKAGKGGHWRSGPSGFLFAEPLNGSFALSIRLSGGV